MTIVQAQVDIDASPARVWAVVSDPRNLPRWDRRIAAVRGVPSDGIRAGTKYTTDVRFMGVTAHVSATVLELEPERYAKVRLSGLLDAVVETTLEPLGGNRTRLKQRVDYRFAGGPLGMLAAGAVRNLGAGSMVRRAAIAQKLDVERRR